jgi:chaperonin GroEL
MVATAIDSIGKDGSIVVESSNSFETSLSLVEGFRLPAGYVSPYFINDEKNLLAKFCDSYVLVTDQQILTVDELLPTLELVARDNAPLIIVADQVDLQALAALIANSVRGSLKICAINAPGYGEEKRNILKDLATSVGATLMSKELNLRLKEIKLSHLGRVKTAEIKKYNSIFIDGAGKQEDITNRINIIKEEIKQTENLDLCEKLQDRIVRLSSGIAIIRVGGMSETEVLEKKFRIDDAIGAVRCAQLEGYLPGGGISLIRVARDIKIKDLQLSGEDQECGTKIILHSVSAPFRKIIENSGKVSADIVLNELLSKDFNTVYDVRKGEHGTMESSGILDPTKVVCLSLQNALSISLFLINTNYAIIEV